MKYLTICLAIIFLFSCRTGNASWYYYSHHGHRGHYSYHGYYGYYGDHGRHGYYDDYYYYRAPRVVEKRIIIHHQSSRQDPVYVDQNDSSDSRLKDALWVPGGYDVDGNYHEGYYTLRRTK